MFGFKKKLKPIFSDQIQKHLTDYKVPVAEQKIIQDFVRAYAETDNVAPYKAVAKMIHVIETRL